ncbi:MAG: divergent polysaccharide deacetylase family protein, partial [Campylobacteraceae bacterium]|nr:divergent polysaccharide deacetylase family protein [Campylobacteraceae bacterium]
NHTGSKFTSDKDSMDKLFRALKKRHIRFLDSKTTSKSKAKMIKLINLTTNIKLENLTLLVTI